MARWQLSEAHYLNVPDNLWEQQITDRATGRPQRKQFKVPLHLDPNIESDWNYQERIGNNIIDGKIVVSHAHSAIGKDIIFEGPPTPGMIPLDDEARTLSADLKIPFTTGLDEASQANSWQAKIYEDLSVVKEQIANAPVVPGLAEFMKVMAEAMSNQTKFLGQLAAGTPPLEQPDPPPVEYDPAQHEPDGEDPLPDADPPTEEDLAASAAVVATRRPSAPPIRRL